MKINKTNLKKFIKEELKETKYSFDDYVNTASLYYEIELKFGIPFTVVSRGTDSDYWLQSEYYSEKLNKTIIWNYDYPTFGKDIDEMVEYLLDTIEDINNFEDSLPKLEV